MMRGLLTGGLIIFFGYLILYRRTDPEAKPSGIPAFADIPDDVWKEAIKTIKAESAVSGVSGM